MSTSGTGADAGGTGPENRPASRPRSSHRALHAAGASVVGGGGAEGATAHATAGAAARSPGSGGTGPAKPAGHSSRASAGDVGNATSSKGTSAVEAAAAAVLDLPGASAGALAGGEPQVNGGEGAVAGGSAATAADNGTAAAAAPDPAATTAPPSAVTVDTSTRPAKPEGGRPRPSSGAAKERGRADASTLAPANRGTAAARPQSGRRTETGASPRQRPVPHAVKRARARARNITTTSVDLLGDVDTQAGAQQSQETRAVLVAAFKHHFLFASLNKEDLSKAVAAMVREEYEAGRTIIQQNEPGSKFYVLEQGGCEVIVNEEKVADLEPGKGFGELALMYDSPRAATIRATKAAVAWSLDRDVFRAILATTASSRMAARCQFLANVPLLQPLSHQQISKIAEAMSVEEFSAGDYIIRQGERGDKFFVIWEGQVSCTKNVTADGSEQNEVMALKKGDYFGEMALLTDEPRAANVIAANGPLKALALGRQDFDQLLGSLRDVLDRQMGIRVLKGVTLLKDLNDGQLEHLADALRREVFPKDTDIVKEGEEGDSFYIIKEGEVAVLKAGEKGEQQEVAKLPRCAPPLAPVLWDGPSPPAPTSGNFFGERALLKREKRGAAVRATSDEVQCLRLHRQDFDKLLGSLESLTQAMEAREREAGAAMAQQAPADATDKLDKSIKFEDLEQLATLGTGTFGRVRLVRHKPTQRVMALKSMYKAHIVATHQQRNIMNEKRCMAEADHPFVLRLHATFNHEHTIYMLLELVQGGELWSLLYERTDSVPRTRLGGFEQGPAKFYAACVVGGLTHLHENGWAYRDLKPENLLLDGEGFLKIVDFGFAKRVPYTRKGKRMDKTFTLCGTPEYLSPELVGNRGHDKSVDYWAIGILIYELMTGQTPFADDSQAQTFQMILSSNAFLQFPPGFDFSCEDLVRKLLAPNPAKRLGNLRRGAADIRRHRWFRSLDWEGLKARAVESPYKPPIADPLDTSNFDEYPEDDEFIPYSDKGKGYFDKF